VDILIDAVLYTIELIKAWRFTLVAVITILVIGGICTTISSSILATVLSIPVGVGGFVLGSWWNAKASG